MISVLLEQQSIKEIRAINNINGNEDVQIEYRSTFDVKYNKDSTKCIGHLRQEVRKKEDPSQLEIVIDAYGSYSIEGIESNEDKKNIHISVYNSMHPYVRNLVARISMELGLNPVYINQIKIGVNDVKLS